MNPLSDDLFTSWTEDDLVHLLRLCSDSASGLDLTVLQANLQRTLTRLGVGGVAHIAFEVVEDGYGSVLGVGVSSAKDRSGAQVSLPSETVDGLNRAMLEPHAIMIEGRRSRRPA